MAGLVQFGFFSRFNMIPGTIIVGMANVNRKRDFTFPATVSGQTCVPRPGHRVKPVYTAAGREGEVMERKGRELFKKLNVKENEQRRLFFRFFPKQNHGDVLHPADYDAFTRIFIKKEPATRGAIASREYPARFISKRSTTMPVELISNEAQASPDRPPILLVHGMWHGAWVWEPFMLPWLAEQGYKAYALSLSNHAQSPRKKPFNLLRIRDYVDDLSEAVDKMEAPPVLIGHSMGGFIVQKYLENHTVPGAVLMAPVPPFGIWAGTFNVLKRFPLTFLKANLTLNLKHIINDRERYRHILCSANITDDTIMDCLARIDTESYRAYVDMLGLNLVRRNRIDTPLLILGGGKDNAVPRRVLEKTAARYGQSPLIFEEMGHNLMLEPEYERVGSSIISWISKTVLPDRDNLSNT